VVLFPAETGSYLQPCPDRLADQQATHTPNMEALSSGTQHLMVGGRASDAPSAAIYYLDTTGPTYTPSCASVMGCFIKKAHFLHQSYEEETCDLRLPPLGYDAS
jgi:hypothetical protein